MKKIYIKKKSFLHVAIRVLQFALMLAAMLGMCGDCITSVTITLLLKVIAIICIYLFYLLDKITIK